MSTITLFIDDQQSTFVNSQTALMRLASLPKIVTIRFEHSTYIDIKFDFELGLMHHRGVSNSDLSISEAVLTGDTFSSLQNRIDNVRVYTSYDSYNNSKYTEYVLCDGYINRKSAISRNLNTNTLLEYRVGIEVKYNNIVDDIDPFNKWIDQIRSNINFYGINKGKILSLGNSRFDIQQLHEDFFGIHYVQIKCPNTSSKKYKLVAIAFGYGYDLEQEKSFKNIDEILTDNQSIEKIYKLERDNIYQNLQLLNAKIQDVTLVRDINITFNQPGYMSFVFPSTGDMKDNTMTRVTLNQYTGVSLDLITQKQSDGITKFFMNR